MYISQRKLQVFSQVVLQLHQCKCFSCFITEAMSCIRRVVPYETGAFFSVEPALQLFDCPYHTDIEDDLFAGFRENYQDYHSHRKKVCSTDNLKMVDRALDLFDYGIWENKESDDFLAANNICYLAGVQLIYNRKVLADITIHRTAKQRDFDDGEMQLLKMLGEHMQYIFAKLKNSRDTSQNDNNQQDAPVNQSMSVFTSREAEILLLLSQGLSNKEIGERLFISTETVKTHLKKLFTKMSVRSRTELLSRSISDL